MSKLRELLSKATSGKWELYTSNSWRRIGTSGRYHEIIYPITHPLATHLDLAGRNFDNDMALLLWLQNNASVLSDLIEAAESAANVLASNGVTVAAEELRSALRALDEQ